MEAVSKKCYVVKGDDLIEWHSEKSVCRKSPEAILESTLEKKLIRKSCNHNQLVHHYDYIFELFENVGNVEVIYIDFEKAFAKVDFTETLNKAKDLHPKWKLDRWIKAFITGKKTASPCKWSTFF